MKIFNKEKFIEGANQGAGVAVGGMIVSAIAAAVSYGYYKIKAHCSKKEEE